MKFFQTKTDEVTTYKEIIRILLNENKVHVKEGQSEIERAQKEEEIKK